jgi:hypothetical protein
LGIWSLRPEAAFVEIALLSCISSHMIRGNDGWKRFDTHGGGYRGACRRSSQLGHASAPMMPQHVHGTEGGLRHIRVSSCRRAEASAATLHLQTASFRSVPGGSTPPIWHLI